MRARVFVCSRGGKRNRGADSHTHTHTHTHIPKSDVRRMRQVGISFHLRAEREREAVGEAVALPFGAVVQTRSNTVSTRQRADGLLSCCGVPVVEAPLKLANGRNLRRQLRKPTHERLLLPVAERERERERE
eukprot:COSAG03_NODE_9967_length_681_cov_1.044674_1_plen_131_part_10